MSQLHIKFDTKTETNFLLTEMVDRVRQAKTKRKRENALLELFTLCSPWLLAMVYNRVRECDRGDYITEMWLVWDDWITSYLTHHKSRTDAGQKTLGLLLYLRGRVISLANRLNSKYRLPFSISRDAYVSLSQQQSGDKIGNKNGKKMLKGLGDNEEREVSVPDIKLDSHDDGSNVYNDIELRDIYSYLTTKFGSPTVEACKLAVGYEGDTLTVFEAALKCGVTVKSIYQVLEALRALMK